MTWTSFTCGGKYVIGEYCMNCNIENKSIHELLDLFDLFLFFRLIALRIFVHY